MSVSRIQIERIGRQFLLHVVVCPVILSDLLGEMIRKIKITKNPYAHQRRAAGTRRIGRTFGGL